MKKEKWKYKIVSSAIGIFLSLLMLALFGGISIWLYISRNGAFLFALLLTAVMLAVLLLALYRTLFTKILIDENGFYHQTKPGNGRYYYYREIKNAWISSGRDLNGTQSSFCSFETADGETFRFFFMPADSDAVDYLLERVSESDDENAVTSTFKNGKEYRIDGRVNGRMAIVIALVLTAIITLLSVQLFRSGISWFLLTPGIAISAAVSVFLIIRYFCFRVKIDSTGFYFRSNPFNGRYYEYSEIESCREEVKIYRHHHPPRTLYYYYFNFTDKSGRHVRFQFQKPLHGHEIDMLKKRIEKSGR